MANKKKNKIAFNRKCFEEVLKKSNSSIRKLGDVCGGVGWSEKTIRRALSDGKISPELLDDIARYLNVDPEYISGKYHRIAESYKDPHVRAIALNNLKSERYPYLLKQQRDISDNHFLYDHYLENILIIHNLSSNQFDDQPFEIQKKLQLDLEDAICGVLIKYFNMDAAGKDLYPGIFRLRTEIENYDPEFKEPPLEFFDVMMRDQHDPFAEKYKDIMEADKNHRR